MKHAALRERNFKYRQMKILSMDELPFEIGNRMQVLWWTKMKITGQIRIGEELDSDARISFLLANLQFNSCIIGMGSGMGRITQIHSWTHFYLAYALGQPGHHKLFPN